MIQISMCGSCPQDTHSLASTYPQSLFLGVMPVDDHGPYRIILGARAFTPSVWNLDRHAKRESNGIVSGYVASLGGTDCNVFRV